MQTEWYVVTGAPCSGKSTVLRELEELGFRIIPETARVYIERELSKGKTIEEVRGDEAAFQRRLAVIKTEVEISLPKNETIFLDRTVLDSITYFRLVGLNPAEILDHCRQYQYKRIFIFDPLPFNQDGFRTEDEQEIAFLDQQLEKDYISMGYEVVRVPVLSVEERVKLILAEVSKSSIK